MAESNSTPPLKRCTRCCAEKPRTAFSRMAASADGHAHHCKVCAAERYAEWRVANKERLRVSKAAYHAANKTRINAQNAAWRIVNQEHIKARGAEYRVRNREKARLNSVAWRAENVQRSRAIVRAWRAANPQKAKDIVSAWKARHPGRRRELAQNRDARKRGSGSLSKGIVSKLLQLQRGMCACCGRPLGRDYHLDHRTPLALGGAHEDSNMQLLRAVCNLQKNAKDPIEFMRSRGFLL